MIASTANWDATAERGPSANHSSRDEIEWLVEQRSRVARERYENEAKQREEDKDHGDTGKKPGILARWRNRASRNESCREEKPATDQLHDYINQHWKPGLYARSYVDRSANVTLQRPSDPVIDEIYRKQLKKQTRKKTN